MFWVLRNLNDERVTRSRKLVLAVLASHADESHHDAVTWKSIFPSVSTLAKETGYSERAITYCIRDLKGFGYITTTTERHHGGVNHYEIHKVPTANSAVPTANSAVPTANSAVALPQELRTTQSGDSVPYLARDQVIPSGAKNPPKGPPSWYLSIKQLADYPEGDDPREVEAVELLSEEAYKGRRTPDYVAQQFVRHYAEYRKMVDGGDALDVLAQVFRHRRVRAVA